MTTENDKIKAIAYKYWFQSGKNRKQSVLYHLHHMAHQYMNKEKNNFWVMLGNNPDDYDFQYAMSVVGLHINEEVYIAEEYIRKNLWEPLLYVIPYRGYHTFDYYLDLSKKIVNGLSLEDLCALHIIHHKLWKSTELFTNKWEHPVCSTNEILNHHYNKVRA